MIRLGLTAIGILLVVVVGLSGLDIYQLDTYTNMFVYLVLALAVNLVIGYLGILDFSAIIFFAVGAYISVILEARLDWPFGLSWLVSTAATVAVATITSFATSRLMTYFLAIASLALVLVVQEVVSNLAITGGGAGFTDIDPAFGGNTVAYFILTGVVAVILMLLLANLMAARSGRAVRAVRDSDTAAASLGINVAKYRAWATLLSAAVASAAGTLYAHQSLYISPDTFGETLVLLVTTAVVVGGLGTVRGCVVAAALMVLVPRWLAGSGALAPLIYSVLVVLLLLFAPRGLAGAGTSLYRSAIRRRHAATTRGST
jgi:branched-chain amino acid transport system permease protein